MLHATNDKVRSMKVDSVGKRVALLVSLGVLAAAGPLGCGGGATIVNLADPVYDTRSQTGEKTTFGLDYRDFDYSARQAVESFLGSPLSRKPGGTAPWVMAIGRVTNDTTLDIDTDQLVKKIRIALLNRGRVITTTAVGAGGPEDRMSAEVRELEDSDLFNQETVAGRGTMVAPELSLSGKIIQRANRIGDKQQVDYYFQLTATNIETGLAYWEFEEVIAKLGSDKDFAWD